MRVSQRDTQWDAGGSGRGAEVMTRREAEEVVAGWAGWSPLF